MEWLPRVSRDQRARFEQNLLPDFPTFQFTEITPQGGLQTAAVREEYFPVYYVEPLLKNERALGLDIAAQAQRLQALRRPRDTGTMQATAPLRLVQEVENQQGILICVPVYKGKKRKNSKMNFYP